jgi:hypothetical protein
MAFQTLCVVTGSDRREAGHLDPVASARLSALVEVEIEASRTAPSPDRAPQLIAKMAKENPNWGEERLAAELLLKLGIRVSPRSVRRYMPDGDGPRRYPSSQRWVTFVRNHAQAILACDFFTSVTAGFRVLYVFVIMEVGTRRIAHFNVTAHPTAEWTSQQFREVITGEKPTDSSFTTATAFTLPSSIPA